MRKPIGISVNPVDMDGGNPHETVYVACDDGAVFVIVGEEEDWIEMTPVPGSRRDAEQAHGELGDWPLPIDRQ